MKTTIDYTFTTKTDLESGAITHELAKQTEILSKWVVNTFDEATRKGLIELGWTPPFVWWCEPHQREATHVDKNGKRCCDPALGGILLSCVVTKQQASI